MCGIVGYVGNKSVVDILLDGLEQLEYRGYDSSGIAVMCEDEIKVYKAIGKLNNLRDEMYFIDKLTYTQYDYQSEEQTISNYRSGQTVRYDFYSTDPECAEYPLYTARVVLPSYNQYYQDEVCIGASEYSLCQKWSSHNLSYDNFVKKVTEYKNSLVEPEEPVIEENPSGTITFVQLIINFLLDYYIYIIIVLSLGLIALLAIRKKDDIYI